MHMTLLCITIFPTLPPPGPIFNANHINDRVLVFAMALSYGTQDWVEGGVITAVIVLNITIGFWQEFNA